MKYKLLRFSLLGIFAMFFGVVHADYKKVTSTSDLTSGDYLIVYEAGNVAFNGALETLDAVSNTIEVEIEDGQIASSEDVDAAIFTIDTENGTLASASGYYIGVSSNSNGLKQTEEASAYTHTFSIDDDGNAVIAAVFDASVMTLRFNSASNQNRFRYYKNSGQQAIQLYKKTASATDTRIATTVTLGEVTTTGEVGGTISLPTVTVADANGTAIEDAAITWSSSNEEVATIGDGVVNLLAAGTATIKAAFAGDNNYKNSSANFTVTVTAAPIAETITSLKALQEAVTSTSTPVTIQFNDVFVTAVKNNNAYLADADGYGVLVYQKDHGLEAGQVLNGTISANLVLYRGQTEITGFSTEGLTITTTELTPTEKTIDAITAANQSTLVTLKGVTYSGGKLSDGTNEITYYDNFNAGSLEDGATYDITGIVILYNTTLEIAPRTADDIVKTSEDPVDELLDLTLSFPQESYEATMGEDFEEPTLSGVPAEYDGMISYRSSDASVATVSYDGNVTLVAPGTVVITAEALASQTYKYAEASYTLIVKEGETPVEPGELDNPYTYTFEAKTFNEAGTLTLANADWTLATDAGYFGYDGTKGQQIGSGSKPASTITLTTADIPGTITKVVVNTCGASGIDATFSVSVGETAFQYIDEEEATSAELTQQPFDYTFSGSASGAITLSWANNSSKALYVKSIYVEYTTEEEPVAQDITGTWSYANADVMAATMALSASSEAGEVEAVEKNGLKMVVEANGASFRNNGDNIQVATGAVFKVPVRNAGDLVTVVGYPGYSYYTIGNSTDVLNDENTYKAKASDAEAGYVAVTSQNNNNYFKSLSVVQYAPKEKITLDNEPATVTFPFNEGTEGQTATFSNADYFLNSKVAHGDGVILEGKDNKGMNQTWFNVVAKDSKANEGNAIRFLFTPKPGFTFTPTKVSLTSTRFGTNGGRLDIAWQNPDATTVSLATNLLPNRDNGSNPANSDEAGLTSSNFSYEVKSATPAEGTCGLLVNLYSMDPGKHVGFADIIIEGTLSGTEKDVPILASFKINGNEYAVEDVFGESYEATLELPKAEQMVGSNNPLTDVTAASGEVGEISYEEKDDACTITIPMTAGETTMNYVLNVVFKPDFTLEYVAVDGTTVLATQTVEKDAAIRQFAYDIEDVAASKEGYKARGWFKQNYLGPKFTTEDVITGDTKLYAIETEIETPSDSRKYVFNLADQNFYDEDHEGFNSIGTGYWHDGQHGWAFSNGDKIELLVGKKATINFSLCLYSAAGATIEGSNGASVDAKAESDGGAGSFDYEGEEGTLTLTINSSGAVYIHSITVFNTSETNYDRQGDWLIVKKDDASSLLDAIEVAKGIEGAKIFLPDGTYDLGQTVQTVISGKNVSLIGQSAENTIIVTRPPKEGLGTADLLDNTGEGLYMQDISLKNDFSYSGNDGRAASLHDTGTKTICKNVNLLSHQDTYYSNKTGGLYYFEGGELHGTVDYLCGNGKVYYNEVKLVNLQRSSATITANSELYVFNNCTVENHANTYNLGRAWSDNPVCVYLNTTLLDGGEKLVSTRWNLNGINCDYSLAGEYGTKDANGNDITPASNNVTFAKQNTTMNTILDASALETYSIENVLGDWAATAKEATQQVEAPAAEYASGQVSWTPANNGAIAYALFKNGEFVGITEDCTFEIQVADDDELTIRAANARGGFGEAAKVTVATGISNIEKGDSHSQSAIVYDLQGRRIESSTMKKGFYIVNGQKVFVK